MCKQPHPGFTKKFNLVKKRRIFDEILFLSFKIETIVLFGLSLRPCTPVYPVHNAPALAARPAPRSPPRAAARLAPREVGKEEVQADCVYI